MREASIIEANMKLVELFQNWQEHFSEPWLFIFTIKTVILNDNEKLIEIVVCLIVAVYIYWGKYDGCQRLIKC